MEKLKREEKIFNIKFLGNFPPDWTITQLEILGKGENAIVDGPFGSNLKVSDYITDSINGIPVLTTKNLEGNYSENNVRFISREKFEQLKRSKVVGGDIIMAKIGSIGKIGIYPKNARPAIIPANLLKFSVTNLMNFYYVFYYLTYEGFQRLLKKIATATAQPAFNVSKFRKLEIPIAPLLEQRAIVARIEELFSRLDKGVETLQKVKEQLKVYRQAVLKWAFEGKLTEEWRKSKAAKSCGSTTTAEELLQQIKAEREHHYQQKLAEWQKAVKEWEARKLSGAEVKGKKPVKPKKPKELPPLTEEELAGMPQLPEKWVWIRLGSITLGVEYGSSLKSQKTGKVPVLRMGNIKNFRFVWDDLVYTNNDEEINKYLLRKGDVLFNRTNSPELVGKTAVFKGDRKAIFAGYLIRINHLQSLINSDYINYFLNSIFAKNYGNQVKTDGVNQSNINGNKLINYPLPYCNLMEQQAIVQEIETRLSVADKLEQIIDESLQKAEALRQSILKKAFEGKLLSEAEREALKNDPEWEPAEKLLERIKAEKEKLEQQNKNNRKKKSVVEV